MGRPSTAGLHTFETRDTATEDLFQRLHSTADETARAQLEEAIVRLHLDLCDRRAARYAGRGVPYDDLVQIARVGLVLSIRRYRPADGSSFIRFALPTITGEIKRYFRDHGWSIRPPRRVQELGPRLRAAQEDWQHERGTRPHAADLARDLDLPLRLVVECLTAEQNFYVLSLDVTPGEGDQPPLGELLPARHRELDLVADRVTLADALDGLGQTDRDLVRLRFVDGLTQKEIGDRLGISQMQVSRRVQAVLRRLRGTIERPAGRARRAQPGRAGARTQIA